MTKTSKKAPKGAYAVGYAKPPKQSQFKPGQSGNPKGTKKPPPSFMDLVVGEAGKLVKVTMDGEAKALPQLNVVVTALYRKAMTGDLGASKLLLLALTQAADAAGPTIEAPLTDHEMALLADHFTKIFTSKKKG